ncbi:MAG TPA: zinc-ribbon domain-containing protein [Clostridia bacterium]|nr:zinc-ribbon domain-containing protein [Clostridia bacterium]
MVCNKCGSQIDSDSKFCPVCGRFVEEISNNPSPEVKEMDPPIW